MTAVFVAGSHTDVGKTHLAAALIRTARARGLSVEALKPVVSGFDPEDWAHSDPGRLLQALGSPMSQEALNAISPWRYRAPLAPPMAARLEGAELELSQVAEFCRDGLARSSADLVLVEGVGGVMSPLAAAATGLDLMAQLAIPSILVGGSYLGAISHTLTAVETLRGRDLRVLAVVVSESGEPEAPSFPETLKSLSGFLPELPVFPAPRSEDLDWADAVLDVVLAR